MKSFLLVVVVVGFCAGSVFACSSMHGNAVAASLNQIFGSSVAEGENGRGGDHGVFLTGANGQTNDDFTNGKKGWSHGQEMLDWLLSTGAKIQGSGDSSSVYDG